MNSELKRDFRKVRIEDADYPAALRELTDRPEVLYVRGRWPLSDEMMHIGIVGSRHASQYGLQAAERLTRELVRKNIVTVSGLALGIDAAAHRATLKEEGWTVAILGHGFAYQYPSENASLYADIAKSGTLLTEFPYDAPPDSVNFPRRNRIISGLSRGVLVVEAGLRSGALITARLAAEQGRDVFAVPGSLFAWQSQGCHRLIKEGARLVETGADILDEYGQISSFPPVAGGESMNGSPASDRGGRRLEKLTKPEEALMRHLASAPLSIDELVELSGHPVEQIAEVLLALELKGRIQSLPGQRYATRY